ncbi:MAG: DUF104 domain-containing protein [Anaerolineae bacterium]|nr:DUF104 domain-containing protein [Anaerolineae bacterium]
MMTTIEAIFDGRVFMPVKPFKLPANTRVQIAITTDEVTATSFLDITEALALDGPPDWSAQLDDYLYGSKQINGQ